MSNQINAINPIAQSFVETLPQEIIDQFKSYSDVECFGWHWQSANGDDDYFVYAFTDSQAPKHSERVLVAPAEALYNGQKNARRIVAHYFKEAGND